VSQAGITLASGDQPRTWEAVTPGRWANVRDTTSQRSLIGVQIRYSQTKEGAGEARTDHLLPPKLPPGLPPFQPASS
jgi:hypothetical protein